MTEDDTSKYLFLLAFAIAYKEYIAYADGIEAAITAADRVVDMYKKYRSKVAN